MMVYSIMHYSVIMKSLLLMVCVGLAMVGGYQQALCERARRLKSVDAIIVNGGVSQGNEISMTLEGDIAVNLKTGEKKPVQQIKRLLLLLELVTHLDF